MIKNEKIRKIDTMTQEQINDCFFKNYDFISKTGIPLMSRNQYLKVITELTKEIEE